jgi:hypothetical protein
MLHALTGPHATWLGRQACSAETRLVWGGDLLYMSLKAAISFFTAAVFCSSAFPIPVRYRLHRRPQSGKSPRGQIQASCAAQSQHVSSLQWRHTHCFSKGNTRSTCLLCSRECWVLSRRCRSLVFSLSVSPVSLFLRCVHTARAAPRSFSGFSQLKTGL